jgi:hypothetical protein
MLVFSDLLDVIFPAGPGPGAMVFYLSLGLSWNLGQFGPHRRPRAIRSGPWAGDFPPLGPNPRPRVVRLVRDHRSLSALSEPEMAAGIERCNQAIRHRV